MCKDWFEHQFSVLLGPYLGVKLLGHLEMPFNFLKNYQTFPQGLHHVIVSTSNILGIHFSVSTCLPTLGIFLFFYFNSSHPSVCVLLIGISLMTYNTEHLFMCLLSICMSLKKCLFKSFDHIFTLSFCCSCQSSLYILDMRPLLSIFLQSVGCLSLPCYCIFLLFLITIFACY